MQIAHNDSNSYVSRVLLVRAYRVRLCASDRNGLYNGGITFALFLSVSGIVDQKKRLPFINSRSSVLYQRRTISDPTLPEFGSKFYGREVNFINFTILSLLAPRDVPRLERDQSFYYSTRVSPELASRVIREKRYSNFICISIRNYC